MAAVRLRHEGRSLSDKERLLRRAARRGYLRTARFLLTEGGVHPDACDDAGETALMWSVTFRTRPVWWQGDGASFARSAVPMAALLLEHGASVNAASKQGATALHFAVERQRCDAIEFLLARGADPHIVGRRGKWAHCRPVDLLHCTSAPTQHHQMCLDTLVRAGGMVDRLSGCHYQQLPTVAAACAAVGCEHHVRLALVKYGLALSGPGVLPSTRGVRPKQAARMAEARQQLMASAVLGGQAHVVRLLLDYGADPVGQLTRHPHLSFLHYAIACGYADMVDLLAPVGGIDGGTVVDVEDSYTFNIPHGPTIVYRFSGGYARIWGVPCMTLVSCHARHSARYRHELALHGEAAARRWEDAARTDTAWVLRHCQAWHRRRMPVVACALGIHW
jgi:ankyrin repeat protein